MKKKWNVNEIVLIRAFILNGLDDVSFLSSVLKRSESSICFKISRERMAMGLTPRYTGDSIGWSSKPKILV